MATFLGGPTSPDPGPGWGELYGVEDFRRAAMSDNGCRARRLRPHGTGVNMAEICTHLDTAVDVTPSSEGCEDCLRIGGRWVHLRLCMRCGHVGCCANSPH